MASNHPQYLSTSELARILGISPVAVLKRIQKGRIQAKKIGRSYAIDRSYVEGVRPSALQSGHVQEDHVSVMQAAEILHISRLAVHQRITRGVIKAKRIGRHFVIAKSELIKEDRRFASEHPALARAFVSVPEFAEITGTSRFSIFKQIKKGLIKAKQVGRHYVIAREDVPVEGAIMQESAQRPEQFISLVEAAAILGISRIAVFKRIKKGQLRAVKMGRSYAVAKEELIHK